VGGPDDAAPLVCAEGVVVRHGERTVLDHVDLTVDRGELVALVGPNGAGKSTLLHLVAGDADDALVGGAIAIAGRPVTHWPAHELARMRAVLPQHTSLSFPFLVHEVVQMGRAPWAGPGDEADDDIVAAAMIDTDTAHLAARPFPQLSGGEQARVSLARTLAQQTPLLLLDEPTASLDLRHQELVLTLARRHAEQGGAAIVVLHDLGLAARHTDRLVLLADAAVCVDGPPDDVLTAELVSAVYGHPVTVLTDPHGGHPLIVPQGGRAVATTTTTTTTTTPTPDPARAPQRQEATR
jgi:iron complex transport system ATP-binding protein